MRSIQKAFNILVGVFLLLIFGAFMYEIFIEGISTIENNIGVVVSGILALIAMFLPIPKTGSSAGSLKDLLKTFLLRTDINTEDFLSDILCKKMIENLDKKEATTLLYLLYNPDKEATKDKVTELIQIILQYET